MRGLLRNQTAVAILNVLWVGVTVFEAILEAVLDAVLDAVLVAVLDAVLNAILSTIWNPVLNFVLNSILCHQITILAILIKSHFHTVLHTILWISVAHLTLHAIIIIVVVVFGGLWLRFYMIQNIK